MKELLHRLSMRYKFALVLILPLIALSWFATSGILERQTAVTELSRIQALTALAQQSGNWVHQVQLERGMTAGFIGSQGNSFGNRLSQQRPSTEAAAEAFFNSAKHWKQVN
ncbi:nitrate- and nitrite sensing domain-containing protein [Halomonas sp. LY9]